MSYPRAVMRPDRRLFHRVYRLALENSVTGTNYPKRDREKQSETYKMQVAVSQLPNSRSTVKLKELYFIALPHFEGEFAVGV